MSDADIKQEVEVGAGLIRYHRFSGRSVGLLTWSRTLTYE